MAAFAFDFTLRQGAFTVTINMAADAQAVVLFGPSGSGKTSILEAIAGLRTPRTGRIVVNGRTLFDAAAGVDIAPRGRRIGYVPQDVLLFPHLDVHGNVTYGTRRGQGISESDVLELLELTPLLTRRVSSLSGGERQRVALARALCSGPDVLLLDEPLAAVDLARRRRIVDALLTIRARGIPLVYVTHAPAEARAIADYALVMDDGRVVAQGAPPDVIASEA